MIIEVARAYLYHAYLHTQTKNNTYLVLQFFWMDNFNSILIL